MRSDAICDLFDPRRYPGHPGYKDRTTSRDASRKIAARAPALRDEVLRVIREAGPDGLTADEAAAIIGKTEFAIRPRLTELGPRHAALIERSETKRKNASGAYAIVWVSARVTK